MHLIGFKAAGLNCKIESYQRNVSVFNPSAIFIQETKARQKKKFELKNYDTFEQIRTNNSGGGLLIAIPTSMNPVCILEDNEHEILVVEASLHGQKVRFFNAYGPQETALINTKIAFYHTLDLEIKRAKASGALVCIEMDSNAKLGPTVIEGDPHCQTDNGKYLMKVVVDNELVVLNGSSLCEGTITRHRKAVSGDEKSVLDHFIMCQSMTKYVEHMLVDEAGSYSLTKYASKRVIKLISRIVIIKLLLLHLI